MKSLLVFLALSVCSLTALAFPSFDPFADSSSVTGGTAYAATTPLAGQTNVLLEGWVGIGTSATGATVVLTNGSLAAPNNLPSSTGNSVLLVNQTGPGGRYNFPSKTSGSVFYSCLIQLKDFTSLIPANTNTHGGGAFNLGFNNVTTVNQAANPTGYASPLYYGKVTNSSGISLGYVLGIGRGTGSTNRFWETNTTSFHQADEIVFVVASYQFVSGVSNDIAALWVNPDPSTFGADTAPPPTIIIDGVTNVSTDPDINSGVITSFLLANRNTGSPDAMVVDELRLGTNWAQVTPSTNVVTIIPQLSISTLDPNTVQLSWRGDASGFVLQSVSQLLSSGTPWANVPGSPTTSGTNLIQTDAINPGGSTFYRLLKSN